MAPFVRVVMAANHWRLAVDTHNRNHPGADHDCADVSQVDPRRYPSTDVLWASPECTHHSRARGRAVEPGLDLFRAAGLAGGDLVERSRATMWDVVRFAEVHRYRAVIVENVVESRLWAPFEAWLLAMAALGYAHQVVYLNSMHASLMGLPAPQSRDRQYVVFWREGDRAPDLGRVVSPPAWCPACDRLVSARQVFKNPARAWGRYRAQYVYRCPNRACGHRVVEPGWLPAWTAIDWTIPATKVKDRDRPLAAKTLARIKAGVERYWGEPVHVEAAGNTFDSAATGRGSYYRAWPVSEPWRTLTTDVTKGVAVPASLLVPVEGREGKEAASVGMPVRTLTTRRETGLAFVADQESAGGPAGYSGLVMRCNNVPGDPAYLSTPVSEPLRTLTTACHQALLLPARPDANRRSGGGVVDVGEVAFRMLEPTEAKTAMGFPQSDVLLGSKRDQQRMAGNAVTPPAARDLVAVVVGALTGERFEAASWEATE
jgi:DNA (cytosine-5)-methyltransferase 1